MRKMTEEGNLTTLKYIQDKIYRTIRENEE